MAPSTLFFCSSSSDKIQLAGQTASQAHCPVFVPLFHSVLSFLCFVFVLLFSFSSSSSSSSLLPPWILRMRANENSPPWPCSQPLGEHMSKWVPAQRPPKPWEIPRNKSNPCLPHFASDPQMAPFQFISQFWTSKWWFKESSPIPSLLPNPSPHGVVLPCFDWSSALYSSETQNPKVRGTDSFTHTSVPREGSSDHSPTSRECSSPSPGAHGKLYPTQVATRIAAWSSTTAPLKQCPEKYCALERFSDFELSGQVICETRTAGNISGAVYSILFFS